MFLSEWSELEAALTQAISSLTDASVGKLVALMVLKIIRIIYDVDLSQRVEKTKYLSLGFLPFVGVVSGRYFFG